METTKKVDSAKLKEAIKKSPKIVQEYIKELKKLTTAGKAAILALSKQLNNKYWRE